MTRAGAVVLTSLAILALASATARADAPPNSVTLCYDDTSGPCTTNLYVNANDVWLLGDFIVCTDHILTSAAGSETCPATTPGTYYACTPAATGYCNATLVSWKDIRFAVKVTATVGAANLTMSNVGLHAENWTSVLDGVTQSSFLGDGASSVSVPADGAVHVVEFLKLVTTGPGSGAPPPATPTPPTPPSTPTVPPAAAVPPLPPPASDTGLDVIFARLPPGAAAAVSSPQSKFGLVIVGLVLVVLGDRDLGKRLRIPKHKPRPWLAIVGGVLLVLAIATLLAS